MSVLMRLVLGLAILVAVCFGVGLALPRNHSATSRVTLEKSPEEVWPAVRDLGALQGYWSDLKSARRLPDHNGREIWEQQVGGFPLRLIVESASPPSRLVTRVDPETSRSFGGTWTYQLAPGSGGGTVVTVTEDGYVSNPLFRVAMALMGKHRTADGYLRALGDKFDETVTPEHLK